MIAARISTKGAGRVTMLALTQEERNALRCILSRVIDDAQRDKVRYNRSGRIIRDGADITEMTLELERWSRMFQRRL